MVAATNCAPRAIKAEPSFPRYPFRSGHRYALLSLLAAFGVLAFIFSATSPGDDDIQQEFCKTTKSRQSAFADRKAVSNLRSFRIRAVCSALALPTSLFPSYFATARVSIPDDEIMGKVWSSTSGDRSPPTASSYILVLP
jgi:hypothetical protein